MLAASTRAATRALAPGLGLEIKISCFDIKIKWTKMVPMKSYVVLVNEEQSFRYLISKMESISVNWHNINLQFT